MKNRPQLSQQLSFASYEFAQKKSVTRREKFLCEMEQVVPWARLQALIEPKYPVSGLVVRQPVGVARMLRMYFLQQWFGLADETLEDALYGSQSMREFVGIVLSREPVPDATTLQKFRRLLEEQALMAQFCKCINAHPAERGLLLREGTMADATIDEEQGARDPEVRQTKKGNAW